MKPTTFGTLFTLFTVVVFAPLGMGQNFIGGSSEILASTMNSRCDLHGKCVGTVSLPSGYTFVTAKAKMHGGNILIACTFLVSSDGPRKSRTFIFADELYTPRDEATWKAVPPEKIQRIQFVLEGSSVPSKTIKLKR